MLKASIIGNIGSDPELRYSASGSPFLRFNVASNGRTRTPAGEWQDTVEWVRCTVFGQRAEALANLLHKGTRVYCDGRLEARPWTGQNGQVNAGLELMASDVEFAGTRQTGPSFDVDELPLRVSVTDERRGGAAVAERDDGDLEGLPF